MITFVEVHRRLLLGGILAVMFGLSVLTMVGDSATVDEVAHISAGYSYVAFHQLRLNPEHPPLIKDLAGLPLLFMHVRYPTDSPAWTTEVNGQYETGRAFIYRSGNNADRLIFAARVPMLLLSLFFGLILYLVLSKHYGIVAGLLALILYALDPNFLAHNHLVTTDVGIAFATFVALTSLVRFLNLPTAGNLAYATLGLAFAELTKFSAMALLPFYSGMILLVLFFSDRTPLLSLYLANKITPGIWRRSYLFFGSYFLMLVGVMAIVYTFYIPHTWRLPADKQIELIKVTLANHNPLLHDSKRVPREMLIYMAKYGLCRPLVLYFLGVIKAFARIAGGNDTYFLGKVTSSGILKLYFPVTYVLKEPVSMICLFVLSIGVALRKSLRFAARRWREGFRTLIRDHLLEMTLMSFAVFYAGISISGNLHLGIRHLFPILPSIYALVASSTALFLEKLRSGTRQRVAWVILVLMLGWYCGATIAAFPHYLSYFNEIVGGGQNGYRYFTDSNLDWGQDLKRLKSWTDKHPEIKTLKLDYFGGADPEYYFCRPIRQDPNRLIVDSAYYDCGGSIYQEFRTADTTVKGWIAVSATFLENGKLYAEQFGPADYAWLRTRAPYARIGNSIFVYWVT